jgi:hypothetical protein
LTVGGRLVVLVLPVVLLVAACGGGGESAADKAPIVDELMAEAATMGSPNQDCIRSGLESLSTAELEELRTAMTMPAVVNGEESFSLVLTPDLRDAYERIADTCVGSADSGGTDG